MKIIELKPIKESTEDYEKAEKRLKDLFKRLIYLPLLEELGPSKKKILVNTAHPSALLDALYMSRITYYRGIFSGQFNSEISKELRALGAKFDKREGTYKLPYSELPQEIKNIISASETHFQRKMAKIDQKLAKLLPEEIADKVKMSDIFDKTLWKTDRAFKESVKKVAVSPILSPEQRKRIAEEWEDNMKLYIKNFTEQQIKELRQKIKQSTFDGNRHESIVKTIQDSYGVSANKAKFLARQETSLLMAKFKETQYIEAGVHEYKWGCVHRPHDTDPKHHTPGNVRYSHGILEGKIFRWDNPPVTTNPGEPVRRNNPMTDFNCRCYARPIVKF